MLQTVVGIALRLQSGLRLQLTSVKAELDPCLMLLNGLVINPYLSPSLQALENLTAMRTPLWISPALEWDAETFGKGLALKFS